MRSRRDPARIHGLLLGGSLAWHCSEKTICMGAFDQKWRFLCGGSLLYGDSGMLRYVWAMYGNSCMIDNVGSRAGKSFGVDLRPPK